MTHMHITSWVLAVILFIVATVLLKKNNQKQYKLTHMILRVVYLLIIATGAGLLFSMSSIGGEYIGKAVMGIAVIGLAEMSLVKASKGKNAKGFTIAFVIVLLVTVAMGLQMPMGFDLF